MYDTSAILEISRWGYVNLPGILFEYSKELDIDIEDIGILGAVFYAYQQSKPLYLTGVETGKILQSCPCLSRQKLSRKLGKMEKMGIIRMIGNGSGTANKQVHLEPLLEKLEECIRRDHPHLPAQQEQQNMQMQNLLAQYEKKIEQLELQLDQGSQPPTVRNSNSFKKVADFIAKKTGNLMSMTMTTELRRWLDEMVLTPEFLLCMLELCFERNINNPREISRIASDMKKFSINNVEGMEAYFHNYVDNEKNQAIRSRQFDPDMIEFGNFTGIDMNAEARKRVYYKWRYDWGFSHALIMKAGEIMCQRTKNGGLEYIDSVLNDWMSKEVRRVEDAEKEMRDFKLKKKKNAEAGKSNTVKPASPEYEIYVPPVLEEIDSKV